MAVTIDSGTKGTIRYPLFFAVPSLLIYTTFFVLPTFSGLYYSFTNWSAVSTEINYIGFSQFIEVLKNPDLSTSLINTFIFSISTTVFKNIFGLTLAIALNMKLKSKDTLRAIYFSPAILNIVAMGLIFQGLLNPFTGFVNNFLKGVGLDFMALGWISDPKLSIYCTSMMEVWRATGISMAIYIAGLQTIPKDYYEASTIDGANAWNKLTRITLPLLMPSITINVLLSLIYGFRMFEVIYYLTQGGPGNSSQVMMTMAYKYMGEGLYGYSAAINLMLVIMIVIITIPILRYMNSKEVEG
ncbi:MAG: carbohydrate ABC transporter permease [Acetivibrionales bacterium]|jgi:raffinose/stachyose/melibiose transport system permease protein